MERRLASLGVRRAHRTSRGVLHRLSRNGAVSLRRWRDGTCCIRASGIRGRSNRAVLTSRRHPSAAFVCFLENHDQVRQHRNRSPSAPVRRSGEVARAVDAASARACRAASVPGTGGGRRAAVYLLRRPSGAALRSRAQRPPGVSVAVPLARFIGGTRAASRSERRSDVQRLSPRLAGDGSRTRSSSSVWRFARHCDRRMPCSRSSGRPASPSIVRPRRQTSC